MTKDVSDNLEMNNQTAKPIHSVIIYRFRNVQISSLTISQNHDQYYQQVSAVKFKSCHKHGMWLFTCKTLLQVKQTQIAAV